MKQERRTTLRATFSVLPKADPLGKTIVDTMGEWYQAKHRVACPDEIALVNSIPVSECPVCSSERVAKNGRRRDGVQTYRCLDCGFRFNALTGTLFDSHKIPISEWIEFLIHLVQYQSLLCASLDNQNAYNTGRYWLKKVFFALEGYQDGIRLHGDVGVDECFVAVRPRDIVFLDGRRKLRGLSRNQHCIYCATDGENAVLLPYGMGSPSKKGESETVVPHMLEATSFHDDGDSAHTEIERVLGIKRTVFLASETAGMKDEENPMDDINSVHRAFKRLIQAHGSYDRSNLRGYCDLMSLMYAHHGDKPGLVLDLLGRAIRCKKVLRYREALHKIG